MINILHIVLSLNIGGLETFVIDLVRKGSNATRGHIVCLESLGFLGESIDDIAIFSLEKLPGIQLDCIKKIRNIVGEYSIDLIHTHNEGAHFYGAIAGFLSGIPVVHTRHGIHDSENLKRKMLEWFSSLISKKVVGVSQDISKLYVEKIKIARSKVRTILNGVDPEQFARRAGNRELILETGSSSKVILMGIVARLVLVKDHKTLFEACRIVAKSHNSFRLVVVGDGPEMDNLVQLSQQLGLSGNIIFTGARRDIADLLNGLDIFVLSSSSEGISITLLEAMACELPIVATQVGGNPEVVVDAETGFLVPPENPKAFAEKLLLLMQNPDLRRSMGTAGRARVLANFSVQKSVKEYHECYRQALGRMD
jgi:sugar transferase (PEP-CTERM/EpsH1 system associated)